MKDFISWAKQFVAISDFHIEEFLNSVEGDLSLHEIKSLFSNKYQNRIEFSYVLQVEREITRDLHVEKIDDSDFCDGYGHDHCYGFGYRYGNGSIYRDGVGYGYRYGFGYKDGAGDGYVVGNGSCNEDGYVYGGDGDVYSGNGDDYGDDYIDSWENWV